MAVDNKWDMAKLGLSARRSSVLEETFHRTRGGVPSYPRRRSIVPRLPGGDSPFASSPIAHWVVVPHCHDQPQRSARSDTMPKYPPQWQMCECPNVRKSKCQNAQRLKCPNAKHPKLFTLRDSADPMIEKKTLNRSWHSQGSAPGQGGEEAVQRKRAFRKVAPSISLQVFCEIGCLKTLKKNKKTILHDIFIDNT